MKRRLIFGFVTIVLAANLFLGAKVYSAAGASGQKDSAYSNLELFTVVLERVRKEYVDGTNITYQKLVYGALKGMVNTLDPHSEFLDPEEYKELQSDTEGNFGGLGIVVGLKQGWVTVIAPMDDSPGFKAGIVSGDRIVKIEGRSTENLALPDAVKELRGEAGTKVTITIFRPSANLTKDFTLTRAIINVDMVKDINGGKEFKLGPDKVGYIRIIQFGEKTGDELDAALKKLKSQGMEGLVLDLRWNPGGLLDQAVEVCSKFLPHGQLVVSTEGRNLSENYSRRATGSDELKGAPIVVLANIGSASAAEIVTGCLQDLHRAVVLGEKTFGKGSVQSVINLDDGSALKLTTAKYYTPSHKVIHEHGITPDIFVPLTAEQEHDINVRRTPGGLETLDDQERARVEADRDPQMDRASDLLKGLILYTKHANGTGKNGGEGMTLLALETSCDETSAAVVRDGQILSNAVSSQVALHAEYGGVVPELAAREHLRNLIPVTQSALQEAGVTVEQLDAVAATQGPGLSTALLVGLKAAQAIAFTLRKPFVGINHHEAHLYSPWIGEFEKFQPNVSLIVSGGHTMIVLVESELKHRVLGGTIDDAAGECFDKTGKLIGLPYPAGPEIDRLAEQGNPAAFDFPRPLMNEPNDDFSFSGLKTSVRYFIRDNPTLLDDPKKLRDLCASVQAAIVEVLVKKTMRAAKRNNVRCVTASGGVICNRALRKELEQACKKNGFAVRLAEKSLCTDNAGMIGILAERKLVHRSPASSLDEEIKPGWVLA